MSIGRTGNKDQKKSYSHIQFNRDERDVQDIKSNNARPFGLRAYFSNPCL